MLVEEIMSADPVTITGDISGAEALRLLSDHGITVLPVVDASGRIRGVVSESDLLPPTLAPDARYRGGPAVEAGGGPARVEAVMSRVTVVVHPETDAAELLRTMRERRLTSLPVVDAADRVVGMVSRSDLVRVLADRRGS